MKETHRIKKYIATNKQRAVKTAQEIISIPTVNPPGENYKHCADLLAEKLRALRMKVKVIKVPWSEQRKYQPTFQSFPRYNVIGRWDVGAKKTLHFNAHYDVVPVSGKWRYGPFEPKVSGGWLYGRGSADMKGSIASLLLALECLYKTGSKPSLNIEVSFTADEETGGHLGAGYIVRNKLISADYALVMEGGKREFLGLGHNGVLWLEGHLQGKAAHGAWPELGINAFEQLTNVSSELFKLRDRIQKKSFKLPKLEKIHPTINIGGEFGCGAGSKINTVSASAKFTIDRRLVPSESLDVARAEISSAVARTKKKIPELKIKFDSLFSCEPCSTSPDTRYAVTFKKVIEDVLGKKSRHEICRGFTDLHYFVVDGKLQGLGYGPDGENYHGIDERTEVAELARTAEIYARLMIALDT